MTKGSNARKADYPIDTLFLDRWSPRAMSGEELSADELMALLEAARWAPSSYNNQPWRIVYARRNTEHWARLFNLLVEPNQVWAKNAAVLLVFISKTTFDHNGEPSPTHSFDTGAAWENLALQGSLKGLVVHGMQGFDYDRAKTELEVSDGYKVEAMAVIGKPGQWENLPEKLRQREFPSDRRKLSETAFEGTFKGAK
ncbi:MAG TPA: nitroreductase family protein [Candidatus Saccharimonadales bacterium]|nr:nitroreductase family protein [Candidatus Saccharimonadales bacterium]